MSSVILRTVKHRLAEVISKPGGMTVEQALSQADAELATNTDAVLEQVAARVTALEALPMQAPVPQDVVEQAYALACDIVNVTGSMKMPELFGAAYSLCDILDYFRSAPFSREAFDVHVQALRLILTQGEGPGLQSVVSGLKAVKARVLAGKVGGG